MKMKKIILMLMIIIGLTSLAYANIHPDNFFSTYNCAYWNESEATNSGYMFYADFNTTDYVVGNHKPDWSKTIGQVFTLAEGKINITNNTVWFGGDSAEARLQYVAFDENASNYTINYFLNCTAAPTNAVTYGFNLLDGAASVARRGGLVQNGATFSAEGADSGVTINFNKWHMITAIADPVNGEYCYYVNNSESLGCTSDAGVVDSFQVRYGRAGSDCFVDTLTVFTGSGIDDCPQVAAAPSPQINITLNFTSPTPSNNTNTTNRTVEINMTIINATDMNAFSYNWDGINYSFYDDSLIHMLNLDNISSIGENASYFVDLSLYAKNLSHILPTNAPTAVTGRYGKALDFDGINDRIGRVDDPVYDIGSNYTVSAWVSPDFSVNNQAIMGTFTTAGGSRGFILALNTSGGLRFYAGGSFQESGFTLQQDGTWQHVVYTNAGSDGIFYVDGVRVGNTTGKTVVGGSNFFIGVGGVSFDFEFNGRIDETRIWNRTLSSNEVFIQYQSNFNKYDTDKWNFYTNQTLNSSQELGLGSYTVQGFSSDTSNRSFQSEERTINVIDLLELVFLNQTPADLHGLNAMDTGLTIFYNITSNMELVNSTIRLYTKQNSTDFDYGEVVNGTALFEPQEVNGTNGGTVYNYHLDDNQIYPGTYNIPHETMEDTAHLFHNLANDAAYVKIEILNVSTDKPASVFEIMLRNESLASDPARIYYCNSSYTTGNPASDTDCTLFFDLLAGDEVNHTHSVNSYHALVPFSFNSSGELNSVRVTSTSYFLVRGNNGASASWDAGYIADIARTGASQTSVNNGVTWSDLGGSLDAHLHQFNSTDSVYYWAGACDVEGYCENSTVRSDDLGLTLLPPTSPLVHDPRNISYNADIIINWSAAISPNGLDLTYNLSIFNSSFQFDSDIVGGLTNLSYTISATSYDDGNYTIRVMAIDNESQTSVGFSDIFIIDTTAPIITITDPANNTNHSISSGALPVDISCTDANPFLLNYTFDNGTVLFSEQTGAAVGTTLSIVSAISTVGLSPGWYNFNVSCSDDHTNGDLRDLVYNTQNITTLSFYKERFPGRRFNISLGYYINGDVLRLNNDQVRDYTVKPYITKSADDSEYNFGMRFILPAAAFRPGFKFPKHGDLILRNEAEAHFVWDNEYYVDHLGTVCREDGRGGLIDCLDLTPSLAQTDTEWFVFYDLDLRETFDIGDNLTLFTNSIGGLNIAQTSHRILINNASLPDYEALDFLECPETLVDVGLYFLILLCCFFLLVLGIVFRIPIFTMAGGVILLFFGIHFHPCENSISYVLIGSSVLILFRSVLVGFSKPSRGRN